MSDNRPDGVILSYKDNTISYEMAIQQLCKPNSMRQLYIGNQQLCNELKIVSVTEGDCDDASINNRE